MSDELSIINEELEEVDEVDEGEETTFKEEGEDNLVISTKSSISHPIEEVQPEELRKVSVQSSKIQSKKDSIESLKSEIKSLRESLESSKSFRASAVFKANKTSKDLSADTRKSENEEIRVRGSKNSQKEEEEEEEELKDNERGSRKSLSADTRKSKNEEIRVRGSKNSQKEEEEEEEELKDNKRGSRKSLQEVGGLIQRIGSRTSDVEELRKSQSPKGSRISKNELVKKSGSATPTRASQEGLRRSKTSNVSRESLKSKKESIKSVTSQKKSIESEAEEVVSQGGEAVSKTTEEKPMKPTKKIAKKEDADDKSKSSDHSKASGDKKQPKIAVSAAKSVRNSYSTNSVFSFALGTDTFSNQSKKQQHSFQIESVHKFQCSEVQKILGNLLEAALFKMPAYNAVEAPKLSMTLASEIRFAASRQFYDRTKICVEVFIGEKRFHGVHVDVRCLWDRERDSYQSKVVETSTYYIIAVCYGLYKE